MTLTQIAKNSILKKAAATEKYLAELSAIIHTAGSIVLSRDGMCVEILSENEGICDRVDELLINFYGEKTRRLKVTHIGKTMSKAIIEENIAPRVLMDTGVTFYDENGRLSINNGIDNYLVAEGDERVAYIRGAFLGCGYLNTSSGYRVEFVFSSEKIMKDFQILLKRVNILTKNILRNSKYVLYLSKGDNVCDLLALVGADNAVLELYNQRANRSVRNAANRTANCINANIDRAVSAAVKQTAAIDEMSQKFNGLDFLPEKLRVIAKARLDNPSATLSELAEELGISKSGVSHRLNKIMDIYNKMAEV